MCYNKNKTPINLVKNYTFLTVSGFMLTARGLRTYFVNIFPIKQHILQVFFVMGIARKSNICIFSLE